MVAFTPADVADAARAGHDSLVVLSHFHQLPDWLDALGAEDGVTAVRRSHGVERVEFGRASVRFTTPRTPRERGVSVDRVYLTGGTLDVDSARYQACVLPSGGCLIRA